MFEGPAPVVEINYLTRLPRLSMREKGTELGAAPLVPPPPSNKWKLLAEAVGWLSSVAPDC